MTVNQIRNLPYLWYLAVIFYVGFGAVLVFNIGPNIPFERQTVYLDRITSISSIIFGVTGAWLAIMYPKALLSSTAFLENPTEAKLKKLAFQDTKLILNFIHTMVVALTTLIVAILIPFAKDFLSSFPILLEYKGIFRGGLLFLIFILSTAQIVLLIVTLISTKDAIKEIEEKVGKAKGLESYTQSIKKED